ncbi:MAG: hypothetical protein NVSMB16_01770 [Acidimicrobiales bacterium]
MGAVVTVSCGGYEVLFSSGLGFGGSGGNIELDDPDWDAKAAAQLITFLGNRPEVVKQAPGDPRVGMIGGSYGEAVLPSTASIDPRLDAIVPIITGNDLSYSLTPNNDAANFIYSSSPPGVPKNDWTELFIADGATQPRQHLSSTPVPSLPRKSLGTQDGRGVDSAGQPRRDHADGIGIRPPARPSFVRVDPPSGRTRAVGLVIGIDADDTLWHNEKLFSMTEQRFVGLVAPWADGVDVAGQLLATERRNLASLGYGVKSFMLSMIETAIEITNGTVPATVIGTLLEARVMMDHPVELLDGAEEAVADLARRWPVVLVTKGDLFHQESKIDRSGLASHFSRVEIVSEKDPDTYRAVIARAGITPADFVMVGDSMRSDIAPVLALGGCAVHVPGFREWELERAEIGGDADGRWWRVDTLSAVPPLLVEIARRHLARG